MCVEYIDYGRLPLDAAAAAVNAVAVSVSAIISGDAEHSSSVYIVR